MLASPLADIMLSAGKMADLPTEVDYLDAAY